MDWTDDASKDFYNLALKFRELHEQGNSESALLGLQFVWCQKAAERIQMVWPVLTPDSFTEASDKLQRDDPFFAEMDFMVLAKCPPKEIPKWPAIFSVTCALVGLPSDYCFRPAIERCASLIAQNQRIAELLIKIGDRLDEIDGLTIDVESEPHLNAGQVAGLLESSPRDQTLRGQLSQNRFETKGPDFDRLCLETYEGLKRQDPTKTWEDAHAAILALGYKCGVSLVNKRGTEHFKRVFGKSRNGRRGPIPGKKQRKE